MEKITNTHGGVRPGAGRPKGETGEARPQNQLRAYKDEWDIIRRFAKLIRQGHKDECLKFVEELEK